MSDSNESGSAESSGSPGAEEAAQAVSDEQSAAGDAVKKVRLVVIGFIAVSLVWYLLADRFTPLQRRRVSKATWLVLRQKLRVW